MDLLGDLLSIRERWWAVPLPTAAEQRSWPQGTCGGLRVWLGPCRSLFRYGNHRAIPSLRSDHICTRVTHFASSSKADKMLATVVIATASPCNRTQVKAELLASEPDSSPFLWSYTEEPHRTRRQAIIKAHPEVKHLGLEKSPILMRTR